MEIVAKPLKRELVNRTVQTKPGGTFTAPGTDEFLAFAVIVRRGVVTLGGLGTILLRDSDHA
jgi:hypothetical protein